MAQGSSVLWHSDAARDAGWVRSDVTRRGALVGEAAWRVRHTDLDRAARLAKALKALCAVSAAWWLLAGNLPLGWGVTLVAAAILGSAHLAYRVRHWYTTRGMNPVVVFLPDFLLPYWQGKGKGKGKAKGKAKDKGAPGAGKPRRGDERAVSDPQAARPIFEPVQWTGSAPEFASSPPLAAQPSGWLPSPSYSARGSMMSPDRSLGFGSPMGGEMYAGDQRPFKFRGSQVIAKEQAPPSLVQLADASYRSILALVKDSRGGSNLLVESSTLQRDLFQHLVVLHKRVTDVEHELKEMKTINGIDLEQFSCMNALSEEFAGPQAPQQPAGGFGGGFGGGGFGGGGGGFGGFGQKQQQVQQQPKTKEEGLREVIAWLSTELNTWGGDRPEKGGRQRMKAALERRLKLERHLQVENNLRLPTHAAEYDTRSARTKQNRAHRQKFVERLAALVNEGTSLDGRRDAGDSEVTLHAFAALLDSLYFAPRSCFAVEWTGSVSGGILRYSTSKCPGFLQLNIEPAVYEGAAVFVVKHVDRDLGINTTYYTNPQRSLCEAICFFDAIFDSKHPNSHLANPAAAADSFSITTLSRVGVLSRQFWDTVRDL